MQNDKLSLREAAKLLDFAPATLKRMISDGELKADVAEKGNKKRYRIAKKDLPAKAPGSGRVKAPAAPKKRKYAKPTQHTPSVELIGAAQFVSRQFTPDKTLNEAEVLLRTCFLQWCAEKLLAA